MYVDKYEMQPISQLILKTKYLRDKFDSADSLLDFIAETFAEWQKEDDIKYPEKSDPDRIVINNIADRILDFYKVPKTKEDFRKLLDYFRPGGRIMSNAGRGVSRTTLVNCTGLGAIEDSMEGILEAQNDYVKLLQSGTGVGINFSTLRPAGDYVKGVDGKSSGPVSFMRTFDAWSKTVESAGSRRGASIAVLDVSHPDIHEFIKSKEERGSLTQFNISVGMTEDFMKAFERDEDFELTFNGKVYSKEPARKIMDEIITHTYNHAEPGVLFFDNANKWNPLNFAEEIKLSNPCGEIVGTYHLSCILGSLFLNKFVRFPFEERAEFDFIDLTRAAFQAQCFLDLVIDHNNLPIQPNRIELKKKRKRGLGFSGLADAMIMLGYRYGDDKSVQFAHNVQACITIGSLMANVALAHLKEPCPVLDTKKDIYRFILSPYYGERVINGFNDLLEEAEKRNDKESINFYEFHKMIMGEIINPDYGDGFRFTHATSIAPTATISLTANNPSSGIEPVFMFGGLRNVITEGSQIKKQFSYYDYAFMEYVLWKANTEGKNIPKNIDEVIKLCDDLKAKVDSGEVKLPYAFVSALELSVDDHLNVLAAVSHLLDQSASKTINCPADMPYEDFKEVYLKAWRMGIKGVTTYRPNPEMMAAVLVDTNTQKNTRYEFTLEDGSKHIVYGDQQIQFEDSDDTFVASNVYDNFIDPNRHVTKKKEGK